MDGKISNFAQVASVRLYTIIEGKERGLDVLDCDNGKRETKLLWLERVNNI